MQYAELLIAALALISIGVALGLSAFGVIEIPDALYQSISTIALAVIATRGGRMVQRKSLKRKYESDNGAADLDAPEEFDHDPRGEEEGE